MRKVSNLTIKDAQKRVDSWVNQFKEGYWPPLSMLASIIEEVGELSREINAFEGYKPKKKERQKEDIKENIALELADIIFSVICMANHFEIDLEDYFTKIIEKYDKRDSDRWTLK